MRLPRFLQSLRRSLERSRRASRPKKPSRRLELEGLEDRTVPTILFTPQFGAEGMPNNNGTGEKLSSVPVYLIFWGSGWSSNSYSGPTRSAIETAVSNLLSTPYLGTTAQYGTDGSAHFVRSVFMDPSSPPAGGFSDGQLQNEVTHAIDDLGLPEPDDGGPEPIYLVITPPNIGSTTYPSAGGYHGVYDSGDYFLSFQFEHEETVYGWASDSGSIDSITTTVSHEIAEAMTDPQNPPGNGAVVTAGANWPGGGLGEIGDFEAQNYRYRVNGVQIQSLWSNQAQAFAVADGTSQTFTVNNGVLTVNGDQFGVSNDTITLDTSANGGVSVTLNGETATFDPGVITGITVQPGGGTNTINIEHTLASAPVTVNDSTGSDAINICPTSQFLDNLRGNVTINGDGATTLTLDDQTDTFNDTYTITTTNTSATVQRNASALITYHGLSGVVVNGGPGDVGGGITYNVNGTMSGTPVTVNAGAGNDTFNVSPSVAVAGGSQDTLFGALTLHGNGGTDALNVNDQADAFSGDVYTITSSTVQRTAMAQISYDTVESLVVNGGSHGDTYNITSTAFGTPVTVNAGAGNDTINVSPSVAVAGGSQDTLFGALTLHGNGGTDALNVNDQADAFNGDVYTITSSTVQRTAMAQISYDTVESLVVNGAAASTVGITYNINSTASTTPVTVNAGGGKDTVNIGTGTLNAVAGGVTVNGHNAADAVNLMDQTTAVNYTYTVTASSVSRPSFGGLTYSGLGSLTLNSENGLVGGINTTNVTGTAAGTTVTLNEGAVTSFIYVGSATSSLDAIQGALVINGHAGSADNLNFNDQAAAAGHTYTFTANTLTRNGAALMTFNHCAAVNLTGTAYNDSLVLQSLPAGVTMDLELGAGYNAVYGPNTSNTWSINGSGRALLNSLYTIGGISALAGGTAPDRFVFRPGGAIPSVINGGGGGDTLDYSQYNTGVTVNLGAYGGGTYGFATGVGSSVNNIEIVIGSPYNDVLTGNIYGNVLVGGGGHDVLTGGSGRNILIGGHGGSQLTGGTGDDILIGGYTDYDSNATALHALLGEWQSTADSYLTRISKLRAGISAGGSSYSLVWGTSVHDNGAADTLRGDPVAATVRGMDWFFANLGPGGVLDAIADLQSGEKVNNQP